MDAANAAISSPLLEDASVSGARGVIINVTGGPDLSLVEVSEASAIIQEAAHEEANIIFGAVVDPKMAGKVKITVIATGFDGRRRRSRSRRPATAAPTPVDLQLVRLLEAGAGERSPLHGGARMSLSRAARARDPDLAATPANEAEAPVAWRRVRAGVAAGRSGVPATAERVAQSARARHIPRVEQSRPRRLAAERLAPRLAGPRAGLAVRVVH